MAFPKDSRIRTYAPGTVIRSADLNAMQDAHVAGSHGLLKKVIQPEDFAYENLAAYVDGASGPVASAARLANASDRLHMSLRDIPIAAIVEAIRIYGRNLATADAVTAVMYSGSYTSPTSTGGSTLLGTSPTAAGAWSILYTTPFTRGSDDARKIRISSGGATASVDVVAVELEYYMP